MASLKVRTLQPTVKNVIFGASGIAGNLGVVSREQALATIETALQLGITEFDTAPWYGAGLSEEYLGQTLGHLAHVKIHTKAGRVIRSQLAANDSTVAWVNEGFRLDGFTRDAFAKHDYSGVGVREAFAQSTSRLGGHMIHAYRLHDAETPTRFEEAVSAGGAMEELLKLKAEGLIREISLGMNDPTYILKFLRRYPQGTFDSVMMAGSWNLVDTSGINVLLECQQMGVRVHQAGVFGSGLLWGANTLRYKQASAEALTMARRWDALAAEYGLTTPAVAVAFSMLPKCVSHVCLGCKEPAHVKSNVELCRSSVPVGLWHDAQRRGLLAAEVPIPLRGRL